VESWCPQTASQDFLPLNTLITEHVISLEIPGYVGGNWFGRRRNRAAETSRQAAALERHCQKCGEEIAARKFDLLLVHPSALFHVSPMVNYCRLPSILYLQEPYRPLYEAMPQLPWVAPDREYRPFSWRYWNELIWELLALHNKRVQLRYESDWVRSYNQVLVNSFYSRESVMRAYSCDSRVCYLGIDTVKFHTGSAPKEPFVIGLGNYYINKRLLLAVEAIGAMPPKHRPKLVWVGNSAYSPYLDEIKVKAKELGVEFEAKVLIPDEELRDLLSRAAVMIYTSHLEPFGFAPLEANACGTGVVAIAEGGIRETVSHSDSGILVSSSSPDAFAAELAKFTNDLEYAAEFGLKSRAYVEQHWSQEKAIDRLEAEFERLLRNQPGK
jgi:glycosyltransferase involved in cell wall biosynthesis